MLEQLLYDTSMSDGFFNVEPVEPELDHSELNELMQQLMSSIDLRKLAAVYFKQLQQKLNLCSIKIQFQTGSLTLGDVENSCNIKTLDLVAQHQVFASLEYCFSRVLSLREHQTLLAMHRQFKHPLKNALEFDKLKQMAMKDHLTALGNRASYQETMQRLVGLARRKQETFGMLMLDLDKFKAVNDSFGHQEGDKVLVTVAEILRNSLRETDYAFRFGGDEFCCLLPGSCAEHNRQIAERIQRAIASEALLQKHGVSASIGSANYNADDTEHALFLRADKALYAAKQAGRCCIKAA